MAKPLVKCASFNQVDSVMFGVKYLKWLLHRASASEPSWSIHSCLEPILGTKQRVITPQASNYLVLLSKSLGRPYNTDLHAFDLWWLQNNDPHSPITQMGMGVHYNGMMSTLIVPSFFSSNAVIDAFKQERVSMGLYEGGHPRVSSDNLECRKVIGLINPFDDQENLGRAMELVDSISSFSPNVTALTEKINKYSSILPIEDIRAEVEALCRYHESFIKQSRVITDEDREYVEPISRALDSKVHNDDLLEEWHQHFDHPSIPTGAVYLGDMTPIWINPSYQRYCPEVHDYFPAGRTRVTQAILDDDEQAFAKSLSADPYEAVRPDAFNFSPIEFCIYTGSAKHLNPLYEAVQKINLQCPSLASRVALFRNFYEHPHLLEGNRASWSDKDIPAYFAEVQANFNTKRAQIHQACFKGDVEAVRRILDNSPDEVNAVDPWGMTPLIIALGRNHLEVIRLLLENGAKTEVVNYNDDEKYGNLSLNTPWGLFESAKSSEAIQLLLAYRAKPNEITRLVWEAVWVSNINILKWFYRYKRDEVPNESGLKPIELAIYLANMSLNDDKLDSTSSVEVLEWMLSQIDFPICDHWLNKDLHITIVNMITNHNLRLKKRALQLSMRPKCRSVCPVELGADGESILTHLMKDGKEFKLVMKSTADLLRDDDPSKDERSQIYSVYEEFFKKNNLTPISKEEFFEENIPSDPNKNVFVEVCYVDDKIVSFISFTLIESYFPGIGEFLLYYGKLGATKSYNRSGLIEANFRMPQALCLNGEEKPIWVYYKSIRPGGSWMLTDHDVFEAYPKYEYNEDFVRHIVGLTGEEMHTPGKVKANLIVLTPMSNVPLIEEHGDLVGDDATDALVVVYPVNKATATKAVDGKLKWLGFELGTLKLTANLFIKLKDRKHEQLEESRRFKPS